MRKIKFRAWFEIKKEMVESENLAFRYEGDEDEPFTFAFDKTDLDEMGIERGTMNFKLMQYTGLKDKNGREIYEGDIVKIGDYPPYEVIVNDFSMIHCIDNELEQEELFRYHKNCRVIGNIYEHPHLLEALK